MKRSMVIIKKNVSFDNIWKIQDWVLFHSLVFEFDYLIFSTFIRTSLFSKHNLSNNKEVNQRPLLPRKGEAFKNLLSPLWMFLFEAGMDPFPFFDLILTQLYLPDIYQDFENLFLPSYMWALDKDSVEFKILTSM